jgi:hypothetical protein
VGSPVDGQFYVPTIRPCNRRVPRQHLDEFSLIQLAKIDDAGPEIDEHRTRGASVEHADTRPLSSLVDERGFWAHIMTNEYLTGYLLRVGGAQPFR